MGCLGQSSATTSGENNAASGTEEKKILVVVGPSGAGKDSIMSIEVNTNKNQFQKAVFHTTRTKRKGEKEGVDYYFVSKDDFTKMKENNELIESKNNDDSENSYGISVKELQNGLKIDKILYVIIDLDGAKAIKNLNIPANYVSIVPPSEEELKKRLESKTAEAKDQVNQAKDKAKETANQAKEQAKEQVNQAKEQAKEQANQAKEQINQKINAAKKDLKAIKSNTLFNIKVVNDDLNTAAADFQKQLANCYPQIKVTVGSS